MLLDILNSRLTCRGSAEPKDKDDVESSFQAGPKMMAGLFRRAQRSAFQADSELGGLVGQLQQRCLSNAARALIETISYRNLTLTRHALSLRYPHFLRVTAALRLLSVKPGQQIAKQTLAVASFGRIITSTVSDCMQSPGLQGNDSGHVPSYVIRRLQEHLIRRPSRHNLSAIHPRPPPNLSSSIKHSTTNTSFCIGIAKPHHPSLSRSG